MAGCFSCFGRKAVVREPSVEPPPPVSRNEEVAPMKEAAELNEEAPTVDDTKSAEVEVQEAEQDIQDAVAEKKISENIDIEDVDNDEIPDELGAELEGNENSVEDTVDVQEVQIEIVEDSKVEESEVEESKVEESEVEESKVDESQAEDAKGEELHIQSADEALALALLEKQKEDAERVLKSVESKPLKDLVVVTTDAVDDVQVPEPVEVKEVSYPYYAYEGAFSLASLGFSPPAEQVSATVASLMGVDRATFDEAAQAVNNVIPGSDEPPMGPYQQELVTNRYMEFGRLLGEVEPGVVDPSIAHPHQSQMDVSYSYNTAPNSIPIGYENEQYQLQGYEASVPPSDYLGGQQYPLGPNGEVLFGMGFVTNPPNMVSNESNVIYANTLDVFRDGDYPLYHPEQGMENGWNVHGYGHEHFLSATTGNMEPVYAGNSYENGMDAYRASRGLAPQGSMGSAEMLSMHRQSGELQSIAGTANSASMKKAQEFYQQVNKAMFQAMGFSGKADILVLSDDGSYQLVEEEKFAEYCQATAYDKPSFRVDREDPNSLSLAIAAAEIHLGVRLKHPTSIGDEVSARRQEVAA